MEGDLILILGIVNIPLYRTIYETFFQETMRRDNQANNDFYSDYNLGYESNREKDERSSLFILLCILTVMFEFFVIEGTISIFIS